MGLRINTNIPALVAQRNLGSTRFSLDKSLERLSSGSRINSAGDDAAGLAISENMRAHTRGLSQAERNAQDGISLLQVAEGSLGEISNIVIRLRELAVQAASDTVGDKERGFLNLEFQQLVEEVDRIANSAEFNGTKLLNGTTPAFEIQVGTRNNPALDRIKLFDPYSSDVNVVALGINLANVADKLSAQNSLETIDKALNHVVAVRAELGAMQNRLQSVVKNIAIGKENLMAANSRIKDTDVAKESSELAKNQILMQAGTSVLAQANSTVNSVLTLLGQG